MPPDPHSPSHPGTLPPILTRETVCHAVADRLLGLSTPGADAVAALLVSVDPASQAEASAAESFFADVLYRPEDEDPVDCFERLTGHRLGQAR